MSIIVNALSYAHPDGEMLLRDIHLAVATGQKAALVGHNGSGKSTLLRIIAGLLHPTAGEISVSEKPYYVPQHLKQYDAYTVGQLLGVEQKLTALQAILTGSTDPENFTRLNDDWNIEERVRAALSHWGLQHLDLSQSVRALSGGEKTKVFLAGVRIHAPGILLLDEPSNHLDAESRTLLYDLIHNFPGTVLVVSHDRTLLHLPDLTVELSKSGIEVFGGNYEFYQEQRAGKRLALQAQLDESEKTLKQARQKAREVAEQRQKKEARGKSHGQKQALPRIVAGALKRNAEQSTARLRDVHNEKMQDLTDNLQQIRAQVQEYQALKIDVRQSGLHRGKVLIDARTINFAYGTQPLWARPLSFQVRSGDRIRIEGRNGSGKTTLLNLMIGTLRPTAGEIAVADFTYLYLDQEYSMLDNRLTVFEQVQQFNKRQLLEHDLKMMLHNYQLPRERWDLPCAGLSGGEKMKLSLCCLAVGNHTPDLLILDEPTNNLDTQSQEVLTRAISDFSGTVIVISHDQYFVDEIGAQSTIRLA